MSASLSCSGARRVYTHRGGNTDYPIRKQLQYRATGVLLRSGFHAFSGNTAHAAASASQLFRIDPDRIEVIYNGLDFALLEPQRSKPQIEQELGIEAGDFVLGSAAHLRPWKRIDRLLRLVATLQEDGVRLLIIGGGPDRQRLERIAAELDLGDRLILTGMQRHIGDYLQVMDAFCLPSTGLESFGNAAVEAMAVGVPTVVFEDGGGLPEHIEPGQTGFVVANEDELRSVTRRLTTDDALRDRVSAAGKEAIREKYTVARAIERYDALYAAALTAGAN
jgi:glycosyltransferase involved in cell wall biosynthesis